MQVNFKAAVQALGYQIECSTLRRNAREFWEKHHVSTIDLAGDDDDSDIEVTAVRIPGDNNAQKLAQVAQPHESQTTDHRPATNMDDFQRSGAVSPVSGLGVVPLNMSAMELREPSRKQTKPSGTISNITRLEDNISTGVKRKFSQVIDLGDEPATSSDHFPYHLNISDLVRDSEPDFDASARHLGGSPSASSVTLSVGPTDQVIGLNPLPISGMKRHKSKGKERTRSPSRANELRAAGNRIDRPRMPTGSTPQPDGNPIFIEDTSGFTPSPPNHDLGSLFDGHDSNDFLDKFVSSKRKTGPSA